MKISQFNRAKEILSAIKDIDQIEKDLIKNLSESFIVTEEDPNSYNYNKKFIEKPKYPNANIFATGLQSDLVEAIKTKVHYVKEQLNKELDEL